MQNDALAALDFALIEAGEGGLAATWPKFVMAAWNQAPVAFQRAGERFQPERPNLAGGRERSGGFRSAADDAGAERSGANRTTDPPTPHAAGICGCSSVSRASTPIRILYQFTLDDPTTSTRLWTGEILMRKWEGPIYEYACHEGNYGLGFILSAARAQEKPASDQPTK